jgi:hypothetical protein
MLAPILSKFNSLKTSRKGLVAMIEYPSLEAATGEFSESNVLGVGGFGCVYKAVFDGGVTAAVKRLEGGGPECEKEFEVSILARWPLVTGEGVICSCPDCFGCGCWQNELDLLGRIRHPNIVSLLGFCVHEGNHYIVYELMEKGSLDTQLHGTVSPMISLCCLWTQLFLEIFVLGTFSCVVIFRGLTWISADLAYPDEDRTRHGQVLMILPLHFP